jgi:hypothetical protein
MNTVLVGLSIRVVTTLVVNTVASAGLGGRSDVGNGAGVDSIVVVVPSVVLKVDEKLVERLGVKGERGVLGCRRSGLVFPTICSDGGEDRLRRSNERPAIFLGASGHTTMTVSRSNRKE